MRKTQLLFLFLIILSSIGAQNKLSIYFDSNIDTLNSEQSAHLDTFMEKHTKIDSLTVTCSCDDIGSMEDNQILSDKRLKNTLSLINNYTQNIKRKSYHSLGEVSLVNNVSLEIERKENRKCFIQVFEVDSVQSDSNNKKENIESLEVGEKIVLDDILFQGGKSIFLDESLPALEELYLTLNNNPNLKVKIIGHIFNDKGNVKNYEAFDLVTGKKNLSYARALRVIRYLEIKGIDSNRLAAEGKGGDEPSGLGPKYDRRVELIVVDK